MTALAANDDLRQDVLRSLSNPNRWSRDIQQRMQVVAQDIAANAMMDSRGSLSAKMRRNFRLGMIERTRQERERLHALLSDAIPVAPSTCSSPNKADHGSPRALARSTNAILRRGHPLAATFQEDGVVVLLAPLGAEAVHCHVFQSLDDLIGVSPCMLVAARDGSIHHVKSAMHNAMEGRIGRALAAQQSPENLDRAVRFAMTYAVPSLAAVEADDISEAPPGLHGAPDAFARDDRLVSASKGWLSSTLRRIGWKRFGVQV